MRHRHRLPQLDAARPFLTDGGLETTLIFHRGLDLPCFAAFDLLKDDGGRDELRAYFDARTSPSRASAAWASSSTPRRGARTPTGRRGSATRSTTSTPPTASRWRWPRRSAPRARPRATPIVINGVVGPRGDGYDPGALMSRRRGRALPRPADRDVRRQRRRHGHRGDDDQRRRGDRHRPRRPRPRPAGGHLLHASRPTGACPTASRCAPPSSASTPRPAARSPTS